MCAGCARPRRSHGRLFRAGRWLTWRVTSTMHSERLQGSGERRAHCSPGRPLDHRRDNAVPGVIIHSGHDLRLGQLPSQRVNEHHAADDVHLPQLHRPVPLPALVIRPLPAPHPRFHRPMPDQDPIHRHPRRHRAHCPGPLQHMNDPPRTPPRMHAPQLTHRRLHLGRSLMRTRGRPARPVSQARQTRCGIPRLPPADRLPRHPELPGDLRHRRTRQHRQDSPVSLLDNRQLHQRQSRPPATHRNDAHRKADHDHCQPSPGTEVSSISRDRTVGVSQEFLDDDKVHALLQEQGRGRVPEVVEADSPEPCAVEETTESAGEVGGVEGAADGGGEDEAVVRPPRSGGPPLSLLPFPVSLERMDAFGGEGDAAGPGPGAWRCQLRQATRRCRPRGRLRRFPRWPSALADRDRLRSRGFLIHRVPAREKSARCAGAPVSVRTDVGCGCARAWPQRCHGNARPARCPGGRNRGAGWSLPAGAAAQSSLAAERVDHARLRCAADPGGAGSQPHRRAASRRLQALRIRGVPRHDRTPAGAPI